MCVPSLETIKTKQHSIFIMIVFISAAVTTMRGERWNSATRVNSNDLDLLVDILLNEQIDKKNEVSSHLINKDDA